MTTALAQPESFNEASDARKLEAQGLLAATPCSAYWPLFEHMSHSHDLTLLDSEMEDICQVVREMDGRKTLLHHLQEAESKAWKSLARYKFQMFGYWAAIWVHINRIGKFGRPNPWRDLVRDARIIAREKGSVPAEHNCKPQIATEASASISQNTKVSDGGPLAKPETARDTRRSLH